MRITWEEWDHTIQFDLDMKVKLCEVYEKLRKLDRLPNSMEYQVESFEWIEVLWDSPPIPSAEQMDAVDDAVREAFGEKWGTGFINEQTSSIAGCAIVDKLIQHLWMGAHIRGYDYPITEEVTYA
jgi:hypothetical protein